MSKKDSYELIDHNLKMPLFAWNHLVSVAGEDVRDENNFLTWLVWREAKRRGRLPSQLFARSAEWKERKEAK